MSTYDTIGTTDPSPRPRRRWGYVGPEGAKPTVADAMAFCEQQGLDPSKIELADRYVSWDGIETPEEITSRVASVEKARCEHLAKIRELFQEYTERGLYEEEK